MNAYNKQGGIGRATETSAFAVSSRQGSQVMLGQAQNQARAQAQARAEYAGVKYAEHVASGSDPGSGSCSSQPGHSRPVIIGVHDQNVCT